MLVLEKKDTSTHICSSTSVPNVSLEIWQKGDFSKELFPFTRRVNKEKQNGVQGV